MAALTADRIQRAHKTNPVGIDSDFLLGDNQVIYAGSLCAEASDGKLYNLNHNFSGGGLTILAVLYAPERLAIDAVSPKMHQSGAGPAIAEATSGMHVYLEATGLTVADEMKVAYATDDHTVKATSAASIAPVGRILKVLSATYALVHVDGKLRDVYIDTIA